MLDHLRAIGRGRFRGVENLIILPVFWNVEVDRLRLFVNRCGNI